MRDLLSKLDAIVSETELKNPEDLKAKRQALADLEKDPVASADPEISSAITQKQSELEREAKSKGFEESFEIGDEFGISFSEDHEIATTIVDILEDGIVIELDDIALDMLTNEGLEFLEGELVEDKQKGVDGKACWKGYKRMGTKQKGGKTVDNCVKMEDHGPENPDASVNYGEYDREGDMAKDDLRTIDDAAEELYSILQADDNLPEWVQSKITKAVDYIDTARDYMKAQKYEEGSIEEYGDTAKGQKMLTKVQKRAVDRVVSKKADTDPKYAKKNADTANRAWDRFGEKEKYGEGVAEGSLEELANTSLKVKEPKDFVNTNDRKQVTYKVMKFKSGKDTYLINFTVKGAPAFGKKSNWNALNVAFGVREEQDDWSFGDEINTDLTAKNKNQFLIYSTVINAVRKFITEYNTEIDEIIIQGAGERQAVMYQRFFQSAGKYFPGWHHDGKHSLVRDVPRQTGKKVKEQGVAEGDVDEAKYQGREVPLGKKMAGDVKKSKVYVRKPNGNIVKVNFGDKKMRIKKSNPARRKSFRARHNCANPGPRHKARYWSCRSW